MFTGIIEETASVRDLSNGVLVLERPPSFDDLSVGASIAVSGVCLTITELTPETLTFSVIPETFSKTTFKSLQKDMHVNLERALSAGDRLDGHIVQGHVECTAPITNIAHNPYHMSIELPENVAKLCLDRGSITIDGVSLTIAKKEGSTITVALIPHTLENTTLKDRKEGDTVNIEPDILTRAALEHS